MDLPRISIITPTFNAGEKIEKLILSVANQDYRNIEHLFIDGLSSDNTLPVIREYQKKYPTIKLISQKDNGIYDAMNRGIRLSSGKWLYFIGADDELFNSSVFTELYNEGLLSGSRIIYGNVYIHGDTSWARDKTVYDGPFDLARLLKKNICHQAILYPAAVIDKVGYFNEKYPITADWEYNIRCYAQSEFVYVNKIFAIFNSGGKSSGGEMDDMLRDLPEKLFELFHLDPGDKKLYQIDSPFYPILTNYREKKSYLHKSKKILASIFNLIRRGQ